MFPRGSPVQLGHLWLPEKTDTGTRSPHRNNVASKFMQLNSNPNGGNSPIKGNSTGIQLAASEETVENNAAPESAVTRTGDTNSSTPRNTQQSGEQTGAVPKERNQEHGHNDGKRLDDKEKQQVGIVEEITERYLNMGGSLADILYMVNNPQEVIQTALEVGSLTSSEAAEANEGVKKPSEAGQETCEEKERAGCKAEVEDIVHGTKDAVNGSESVPGETDSVVNETEDTVGKTKDVISEAADSTVEKDGTVEMTEITTGETTGAVGGLDVTTSDRAELAVVEAIAMELDDRRVFASDDPDHYESRLDAIDAKMRRVRDKSDFIQQEYARVSKDVDSIRQTLPEMDDMFASLKSFSAAVLSGVKAKEEKTKRKPFSGGELPKPPIQQTKSSEKKPSKSTKKKGGGRKRSGGPGDSASSSHTKETPDQQPKEENNSTDKADATPRSASAIKPSPDTSSGGGCKPKSSTSAKSRTSTTTRSQVEYAAADSTSEPPTPERSAEQAEYPRVVGPKELRPVAGLPPPGDYIPQHIHLLQPADSEIARSETGEERTNILSPIGRLAWAIPHRFMSSKQVRHTPLDQSCANCVPQCASFE